MLAVELGPKAFVIAAKMAEEDWGLALPILSTLAAHCEREPAPSQCSQGSGWPRGPAGGLPAAAGKDTWIISK